MHTYVKKRDRQPGSHSHQHSLKNKYSIYLNLSIFKNKLPVFVTCNLIGRTHSLLCKSQIMSHYLINVYLLISWLLSHVQLFVTPLTVASVHGILWARILEWVGIFFSKVLIKYIRVIQSLNMIINRPNSKVDIPFQKIIVVRFGRG